MILKLFLSWIKKEQKKKRIKVFKILTKEIQISLDGKDV